MNYKEQIFKMLDIQPNEPFRLYRNDNMEIFLDYEYSISENLDLLYRENKNTSWQKSFYNIKTILNDGFRIKKIPSVITKEEQAAVNYFVYAGYNYMAKDKDGKVFVYRKKPCKTAKVNSWQLAIDEKADTYKPVEVPIQFVSWEDSEPFNLKNLDLENLFDN